MIIRTFSKLDLTEVDSILFRQAQLSGLSDWKYFVLLLDEMKIKESFVYKSESKVIGFVNLGKVNDQMLKFEREASNDELSCGEIATHMLTLMIWGIFF